MRDDQPIAHTPPDWFQYRRSRIRDRSRLRDIRAAGGDAGDPAFEGWLFRPHYMIVQHAHAQEVVAFIEAVVGPGSHLRAGTHPPPGAGILPAALGLDYIRVPDQPSPPPDQPSVIELIMQAILAEGSTLRDEDGTPWAAPDYVYLGQQWHGGPDGPPDPGTLTLPAMDLVGLGIARSGRTPLVYVIDTGVIKRNGVEVHGYLAGGSSSWVDGDADPDDDDPAPAQSIKEDEVAHGTFIAGVIRWQAPTADVRVIIGMDDEGVTSDSQIASLISGRIPHGAAALLNLSLGGRTAQNTPSIATLAAIRQLTPGSVVIAAAGNDRSQAAYYPAAYSMLPDLDPVSTTSVRVVIAVGGADSGTAPAPFTLNEPMDERADYSNFGPWVTVWAPGRWRSTYIKGTATQVEWIDMDGNRHTVNGVHQDDWFGWGHWRGTSFATPTVTGAIADLVALLSLTTIDAARSVIRNAGPSGPNVPRLVRPRDERA